MTTKRPAPKRPKTAKAAAIAARRGETDVAIDALTPLAAAGEGAAHATLAELYAFRGDWARVIEHAGRFLASPTGVYAGNVQDDALGLLLAAGHESGAWPAILAAAPPTHRNARLCAHLRAQAEAGGTLPPIPERTPSGDRATREARYETATSDRMLAKKAIETQERHRFVLAEMEGLWDVALERYRDAFVQSAQHDVIALAHHLAETGDDARAWAMLERVVRDFIAVDHAQVAPVVLLVDPVLRKLVTPERAAWVLATPRTGNT